MRAVFEALLSHAQSRPHEVAFRDPQYALNWAMLLENISSTSKALTEKLGGKEETRIGITYSNCIEYVVADLALTAAGYSVVPLPPFFSPEQLSNISKKAQIKTIFGPGYESLPNSERFKTNELHLPEKLPERVIFTSGSSGNPKGVRIGEQQIAATLDALSQAIPREMTGRHFGLLPHAQLLEQICGIYLPILYGSETVFAPIATAALWNGNSKHLADTIQDLNPQTIVMVPALLRLWVEELERRGEKGTSDLKLIALGGAPISHDMLIRAEALELPVRQGYGLSECCSVVSLNPVGANLTGSVGKVLPGIDIQIEAGEIIIAGPNVMSGYLGEAEHQGRWHTGDLGAFEGGYLKIHGRKDNLILLENGRNLSPEWIEAEINALKDVRYCILLYMHGHLILAYAGDVASADLAEKITKFPEWAKPDQIIALPEEASLLHPAGTPDRSRAHRWLKQYLEDQKPLTLEIQTGVYA